MNDQWYVYRHSLSEPIFKNDETPFTFTPGEPWLAKFAPDTTTIEVPMVASADAWHGMWSDEEGSYRLRVARVVAHDASLLIGQVFDPNKATVRRDFFIAVQKPRNKPLPNQPSYQFAGSFLTPFMKTDPMETPPGTILVDLIESGESTITFQGESYAIVDVRRTRRDLLVSGECYKNDQLDQSLRLWFPPVDDSGGVLATGFHIMHGMNHSMVRSLLGSGDPHCCKGVALCY